MPYRDRSKQKRFQADWHQRRKNERRDKVLEKRRRMGAIVAAIKQAIGCIDCGETDPIVLDFDHRDPGNKSFEISHARRYTISLAKILAEIAKCDVRCANCHRRKTYQERQREKAERLLD